MEDYTKREVMTVTQSSTYCHCQ